jgi:predicted butyrate kinase (DUF1464 family)
MKIRAKTIDGLEATVAVPNYLSVGALKKQLAPHFGLVPNASVKIVFQGEAMVLGLTFGRVFAHFCMFEEPCGLR